MSILFVFSVQASEQRGPHIAVGGPGGPYPYIALTEIPSSSSSSSSRAPSQLQPPPVYESLPRSSSRVVSPTPQTKQQKLAVLDKQLETSYHAATPDQQKKLAGIAQLYDQDEVCSCCCPWRTYNPKFTGLSQSLINGTWAGPHARQFNVPALHEYRILEKMKEAAREGNSSDFSDCTPTDINQPTLDGQHILFPIVQNDDYANKRGDSLFNSGQPVVRVESWHRAAILDRAVLLKLDLNVKDDKGNTGLHYAVCKSLHLTKALVKHLQTQNLLAAQLEHKNNMGETPLIRVALYGSNFPRYKDHAAWISLIRKNRRVEMPRYLLSLGANPDTADHNGNSFTSLSEGVHIRKDVDLQKALALHEQQRRSAAPQSASVISAPSLAPIAI